MKSPQCTAVRIPDNEVIPATIPAVPPAGLYTLRACQYAIVIDLTGLWFG